MTHPQRCDSSCTFFDDTDEENRTFDLIYCEKIKRDIEPVFREESKSVGCASHSSAPVPEKVYEPIDMSKPFSAFEALEELRCYPLYYSWRKLIDQIEKELRSHLIHSEQSIRQDEREKVLDKPKFNSTDLLLLANDEWKRREERKHNHDPQSWQAGFINGFLTDWKWARDYVDKLRQQEQP